MQESNQVFWGGTCPFQRLSYFLKATNRFISSLFTLKSLLLRICILRALYQQLQSVVWNVAVYEEFLLRGFVIVWHTSIYSHLNSKPFERVAYTNTWINIKTHGYGNMTEKYTAPLREVITKFLLNLSHLSIYLCHRLKLSATERRTSPTLIIVLFNRHGLGSNIPAIKHLPPSTV